ncbi:MAG: tryptophan--tRNA ligase [Bacteroidota bacterium]|nr:tryptophan--tRNA ligase [Bacteroidota bacterium]MDP4236800.1 tryptophan--tRNA ligase [Bacteroidota bacterium]
MAEETKRSAIIREGEIEKAYGNKKPRILSGMRPTGKLHIGHFAGALEPWVKLQSVAENFHLIADYHVLTTKLDTSDIAQLSLDMAIDWIAFGIDPEKSPIFRQSKIKEHAELFLIFAMLITKARLERNPAVKEQVRDLDIGEGMSFGHLGYPVLQAADILLYKGDLVPVGEDQLPHVEMTREFARDFNNHYGKVFPIPSAYLSETPRLPGTDGNRMSKSIGNTILLSDTPEDTWKKMKSAVTDPQKIRRNDPGRPEICLVYGYHQKWNPGEVNQIHAGCSSGELGCVDCKKKVTEKLNESFAPQRAKRSELAKDPGAVLDIIEQGEIRARGEAEKTIQAVRSAMNLG